MVITPLISVILITYKRSFFLQKTLLSILSQTYQNLEIIVVDDGSQDNTSDVVASLNDSRIKFISIEHSGRPAVPRNVGISYATGDFIAFCDDDDLWSPCKVEEQFKAFIQQPEAKLCHTGRIDINENDVSIPSVYEGACDFEIQIYKCKVTFSSVMISRDVILNGLKFDERMLLKASEDFLFVARIMAAHPAIYIKEPLVQYRIHQNGISFSGNNSKKLLAYYKRLLICFYELFKLKQISFIKFIRLAHYHFTRVLKQIMHPMYSRLKEIGRIKN